MAASSASTSPSDSAGASASSAAPQWPASVELLCRSVRKFRMAGTPDCLILHIDRFPALMPFFAALAAAFVAVVWGHFDWAGAIAGGGALASMILILVAPPPNFQAVVDGHLVARKWWGAPLIIPKSDIEKISRTDLAGRGDRYSRTVFRVKIQGDAHAPITFAISSQAVADQLANGFRRAGMGEPHLTAAGIVPKKKPKRR